MSNSKFSYAKKGIVVRLAYFAIALANFTIRRITGQSDGIVVLCYHSVTAKQQLFFERQLLYIKNRVIPLHRVVDSIDEGAKVVITFDDAFECLLDYAIPLTNKYGIPIAVFAVTGNCGETPNWLKGTGHPDEDLRTMTIEQLRYLASDTGCLVGSHSMSHRRLGELSANEVVTELMSSKITLEKALNKPCCYLALPHGSYRSEVIDIAIRQGYKKILTLDEIALPSRWPDGTIGRFSVSPDMWMSEFILTTHGAYSWLYTWRNFIRRMRNWFNNRDY